MMDNMTDTTYDPIDTDYYCWKVPVDYDGTYRLLTPHSDPLFYEYPLDYMFSTATEATEWLEDAVEDGGFDATETADWVLVHYVGTVVVPDCGDPGPDCAEHGGACD